MPGVSKEEIQRRQNSVASTVGTHAMEGIFPDAPTVAILRRYEQGELTLEQFSAAMDAHAHELISATRTLAGAA